MGLGIKFEQSVFWCRPLNHSVSVTLFAIKIGKILHIPIEGNDSDLLGVLSLVVLKQYFWFSTRITSLRKAITL